MKTLHVFLMTFALVAFTQSRGEAANNLEKVKRVKEAIQSDFFAMEGVNGVGIAGCHPLTGHQKASGSFVYCISVNTETKETYRELTEKYPVGTKIRGVYILVRYVGRIRPQ